VPLPKNWSAFIALGDNKADMERFLPEKLVTCLPPSLTVVVAGGFDDAEVVTSSNPSVDTSTFAQDTRKLIQKLSSCVFRTRRNLLLSKLVTLIFCCSV